MDVVLALNDWWDGPLLGLATYENQTCIFERVFSMEKDEYSNQYYLTPVNEEQRLQIISDWDRWIHWMVFNHSSEHAEQWHSSNKHLSLTEIAKSSSNYRQYTKRAEFFGKRPQNLYSALNGYYVLWQD